MMKPDYLYAALKGILDTLDRPRDTEQRLVGWAQLWKDAKQQGRQALAKYEKEAE